MSNKIILKKSSVAGKVPQSDDLIFGELALNYADGNIFFKSSSSAIDSFPSKDAVATLTNKTAHNLIVSGTVEVNGSVGSMGQVLQSTGTGVQWVSGGGAFPMVDAGSIMDPLNTAALVDAGTIA